MLKRIKFGYSVNKVYIALNLNIPENIPEQIRDSKTATVHTVNWLMNGAMLNPSVGSVPWTAFSRSSVSDSTSIPWITMRSGKICPPSSNKHLKRSPQKWLFTNHVKVYKPCKHEKNHGKFAKFSNYNKKVPKNRCIIKAIRM